TDAFRSVGRIVEFDDNDNYFKLRRISICGWLFTMNAEYSRKYQPIELNIDDCTDGFPAHLLGCGYLLRIIFWDLLINSQPAVEGDCKITVQVTTDSKDVHLLVIDNGGGFPEELMGVAFQERFSGNGAHRGRGLLEVQDAVRQLHGRAQLVPYHPGEYRV